MGRWEPHTRERLQDAALELFERGYDNTTAAEIAERAGTAKSTFFRNFPDKREVLFAGTEAVGERAAAAIVAAPPGTTVFGLIDEVLRETLQIFDLTRHSWYARRQAVVDHNPELRERDLLKRQNQAEAITAALRARGLAGLAADYVAALIGLALHTTYSRWLEGADDQDATALAADVIAELRATATSVDLATIAD